MKLPGAEEQLKRESPAYRPDDTWQELPPQRMQVVVSVRFDDRSARRLAAVARQWARTPSGLIRDWTLERLESMESIGAGMPPKDES